jgi:hypothetical protein
MSPAGVNLAGKLIASAISGATMASLALILWFYYFSAPVTENTGAQTVNLVSSRPFEGMTGPNPINASGIVPIADSRFLVVDDETGDAFFEMRLTADGAKEGPLVRRPIAGLAPDAVEDLEDAVLIEDGGARIIVAVSSLERHEGEETADGLVRVTFADGDGLAGELMPGFRQWLLDAYPDLGLGPGGPDVLDIQGLSWDPERRALLLGVRSATDTGRPFVLPVRLHDLAGPWTTTSLEPLPAIEIHVGATDEPRGIRGLARHAATGTYAVLIGDAGDVHEPFALYMWDGRDTGVARYVPDIVFAPEMKPEGIAYGSIGGRPAVVIVDDNGGYYVLWDEPGKARARTRAKVETSV